MSDDWDDVHWQDATPVEETMINSILAQRKRIEELEAQQAITLTALKQLSTAGCFGNGEALGIDMSKTPLGREILARMEYARATIAKIKGEQP